MLAGRRRAVAPHWSERHVYVCFRLVPAIGHIQHSGCVLRVACCVLRVARFTQWANFGMWWCRWTRAQRQVARGLVGHRCGPGDVQCTAVAAVPSVGRV